MSSYNQHSSPRRNPPNGGAYAKAPGDATVPAPLRPSQQSAISRAEKFEDEKRRIIANCFSKKDEAGQFLLQSYITHVRVEEDGMYPSEPPPPSADPAHKKPRVIIVAVKHSGRVNMHKARENDDGTFQIGKTWDLQDLQAIESFSPNVPRSQEDDERARLATDVGFIITLAKPYFWSAKTPREKNFFVGSLVKIYHKYTSGGVPRLKGFDPKEENDIMSAIANSRRVTPAGQAAPEAPTQERQISHSMSPSRSNLDPAARPPLSPAFPRNVPALEEPLRSPAFPPSSQASPARPTSRGATPQVRQPPLEEPGIRPGSSHNAAARSPRLQPAPVGGIPLPSMQHSNRSNASFHSASSGQDPESRPGSRPGEPMRSPLPRTSSPLAPATTDRWQPPGTSRLNLERPPSRPSDTTSATSAPQRSSNDQNQLNGHTYNPPVRQRPRLESDAIDPLDTRVDVRSSHEDVPRPLIPKPSVAQDSTRPTSRSDTPSQSQPRMPGSFTPDLPEPAPAYPKPAPVAVNGQKPRDPAPTQRPVTPKTETPPSEVKTPERPDDREAESTSPAQRPGLGPMVSSAKPPTFDPTAKWKKGVKAAAATRAFKPRAGGAGERLLKKVEDGNEPDGVTGVVMPPPKPQEPAKGGGETHIDTQIQTTDSSPRVDLTSPTPVEKQERLSRDDMQETSRLQTEEGADKSRPVSSRERPPSSEGLLPKKRRSEQYNRYLASLNLEPDVLNKSGLEFENVLSDFGWSKSILQTKNVDALEATLRKEVSRLEAGSWLGHTVQKDERVQTFENLLDKAIAECDQMEGLLTLYGVELNTLTDDIAYIEAQSQGLQVQTANQRLLHTELTNLVNTISVDRTQLSDLESQSLDDPAGLERIETSLLLVYKALSTMGAKGLRGKTTASAKDAGNGMTGMRALQDRKDFYLNIAFDFIYRLQRHIDLSFGRAFQRTTDSLHRQSTSSRGLRTADLSAHDQARSALWQYSPLMLFVKECDPNRWRDIMRGYRKQAKAIYGEEFRESIGAWKKVARKLNPEEAKEVLFTTAKETEEATGPSRKLTVKRSQTLTRGLRGSGGLDRRTPSIDKTVESRLFPYEVFAGALEEIVPLVAAEQNFMDAFFHTSSTESADFAELATASTPEERRGPNNLLERKPLEADEETGRLIRNQMSDMFEIMPRDLQALIDWCIAQNQLQVIGLLAALERAGNPWKGTNQLFLSDSLTLLARTLFPTFQKVEVEQTRAIEETKVRLHRRHGVIGFIRVFPNFATVVENMLLPPSDQAAGSTPTEQLIIRKQVDEMYRRMNKAIFDGLQAIAKSSSEGSGARVQPNLSNNDPEDKEALNYHIFLIENMHHYVSEVPTNLDSRGDASVLGQGRARASKELTEHRTLYVNAVVRRPIGKLLDFIESTETILSTNSNMPPSALPGRNSSHSPSVFKKILAQFSAKELRKGIDGLKLRVEKHFGEADEPNLSNKLVNDILSACEKTYVGAFERTMKIASEVYEGSVEIEFGKNDIVSGFKR